MSLLGEEQKAAEIEPTQSVAYYLHKIIIVQNPNKGA